MQLLIVLVVFVCAAEAFNRCSEGLIDCRSFFKKCVTGSDICDGVKDCATGFDERSCDCSHDSDCPKDEICLIRTVGKGCVKKTVCDPGYEAVGQLCFDVDECATQKHNCSENEFCINREGSFECKCKFGYYFDSLARRCFDIDECQSVHYCEPPGHCTNTRGSFQCLCPTDLFTTKHIVVRSDGSTYEKFRCTTNDTCEEDHSCLSSVKQSDPVACIDGISCRCPQGYAFNAEKSRCEDVDECVDGNHNCEFRFLCVNTIGGYQCSCPAGFRDRPETTTLRVPISTTESEKNDFPCDDIDECKENLHNCQFNCSNTPGSYECLCKTGYRQDSSKRLCLPIGETSEMLISREGRFSVAIVDLKKNALDFYAIVGDCNETTSAIFTFFHERQEFYFVNSDRTAIFRWHLRESCEEIISSRTNISALEIDWIYSNIYWTDSDGLSVATMNGTHSKSLSDPQTPIKKIVVDPFNGWLTMLRNGETWRIGLDGSSEAQIFEGAEALSLTFDAEDAQIILQTAEAIRICPESAVSLDLCQSLPFTAQESQLLDAFGDFIIVEERDSRGNAKLLVLSKRSKERIHLNTSLPDLGGRIVHSIKQPKGQNRCSQSCSDLCVNSPESPRFACLCSNDATENCHQRSVRGEFHVTDEPTRISMSPPAFLGFIALSILGIAWGFYGIFDRLRGHQPTSSPCLAVDSPAVEMSSVAFRQDTSRVNLVNHEIPPDVLGRNFPLFSS
ncbi:low-density lipoprotein receptor-related protein 1B-like [Galendromus occidentalis]|uniref:Low-density lipoprotein receptor-related protein 1B-like n=1 Tax=Galendromus occidentalis TaxID=34638 RepID=A0AAJ7PA52_9ACAR|nr:low-density lipoprotein receptor-related protein 1B-like [Galendromus occidentalis]